MLFVPIWGRQNGSNAERNEWMWRPAFDTLWLRLESMLTFTAIRKLTYSLMCHIKMLEKPALLLCLKLAYSTKCKSTIAQADWPVSQVWQQKINYKNKELYIYFFTVFSDNHLQVVRNGAIYCTSGLTSSSCLWGRDWEGLHQPAGTQELWPTHSTHSSTTVRYTHPVTTHFNITQP